MSKKKLKRGIGGSDPTVRFVWLQHYLLKSQAWKTMPANAKALLLQVWARHNGANNGEISYACNEAKEIEMSNPTASRMFSVLIERGFLVMVRESSFDRKKIARTWRITAEPAGGKPATKDFMRWRPDATETSTKKDSLASPVKQHSFTSETNSAESAAIASPMKLMEPFWPAPQLHQ